MSDTAQPARRQDALAGKTWARREWRTKSSDQVFSTPGTWSDECLLVAGEEDDRQSFLLTAE